ncbi:hypothetical protein B0T18DRAFT_123318 [Schizothecium vesticola]|uniref:Uncharacterized protein n=1 Tax=Schizothecium vesticola TaxID=314040 RepID=A0AA40F2U3_9PEZI|nr:hypothetical protein B0T18DRAFT_123318 [Schizothecium vesticola]
MLRGLWDRLDPQARLVSPDQLKKRMPLTLVDQDAAASRRRPHAIHTDCGHSSPMMEYKMDCTASSTPNGKHDYIVITLMDSTKTNTQLILETFTGKARCSVKIREAWVYRAADYPKPAYWLTAGKTAVARMWEHFPMVTRVHDIPELAEDIFRPIVETPDRAFITQIWNTTRFVFGRRRFVCKPRNPNKSGWIISDSDTVHEYQELAGGGEQDGQATRRCGQASAVEI